MHVDVYVYVYMHVYVNVYVYVNICALVCITFVILLGARSVSLKPKASRPLAVLV